MRHLLLFLLVFAAGTLSAQLIINDEFTAKGGSAEGALNFEQGEIMPNLRFKNLKAQTFNLHDKLDKLTIIEFWYTTCKTCVNNKQYISKFANQYNINVVSIAIDEKPSTVRKYLADNNIHWDNVQDSSAFNGFYQKTKGVATPTYLIVNTDKEIVQVLSGASNIGKIGVFLQNHF